jgi:hypothetical protein
MVRFDVDFYESSDSVIWKLSIISINIYCEKKVQWNGLRSPALVHRSLNLALPDVLGDDCLMQPDFCGFLKSVSLLTDNCRV